MMNAADHITLVKKIAFLFGIPHLCQDLISAGYIGLMKACKKFDPDTGTQFTTYASVRIRGEMRDFLRYERGIGRRRVTTAEGRRSQAAEHISLDSDIEGRSLHEEIGTDGQINKLRFWDNVKGELSPRHWKIIHLYFQEGKTLAEIGKKLHVSESRTCQLKSEALLVLYSKGESLIKEQMPLEPILTEGDFAQNRGG